MNHQPAITTPQPLKSSCCNAFTIIDHTGCRICLKCGRYTPQPKKGGTK